MKIIIASLLLVLIASSCGKWDGKKDKKSHLTYYNEDFKEKDFDILGVNSSNIDALWVEFYGDKKSKEYTKYALIVKSNGEFVKELGSCVVDWKEELTFTPDGGSEYAGEWTYEAEKYSIDLDLVDRTETLIFIKKDGGKCW